MLLNELLSDLKYQCIYGTLEQDIDNIIYDSRIKTKAGLFIAIEGFQTDGHRYIKAAIENGAKAILVQKDIEECFDGVTLVKVENTRIAMAIIANTMYHHPSQSLDLVGVTGTNGKTSTTYLLGQILEAYNQTIGIIGTIENRIGHQVLKAERTTPESLDLQKLLNKMNENQVQTVLMEVSSHALALNRVEGCQFKVGLFTNLTQDHLDFHHTMEAYALAKAKLFDLCEVGIINIDSDFAAVMLAEGNCKKITYGIEQEADYRASHIQIDAQGVSYELTTPEGSYNVYVPIPGQFTVYNTLGTIAAAKQLGVPMALILKTLKEAKGIPGRIQTINAPKGYAVIIDYAHTPDGLENVLQAIHEFAQKEIITVFGCGGDRDNTKRPLMGEVAARLSTKVIITSDNPRSEEPEQIIDQVEEGVKKHQVPYVRITDRKEAIHHALSEAKSGDVVLVAGKGHENYQILKDRIIHFDDSEIVNEWIGEENSCI